MCEQIFRWYAAARSSGRVFLRYFNACGATPRAGEDHTPETHRFPTSCGGPGTSSAFKCTATITRRTRLHPRLHSHRRPAGLAHVSCTNSRKLPAARLIQAQLRLFSAGSAEAAAGLPAIRSSGFPAPPPRIRRAWWPITPWPARRWVGSRRKAGSKISSKPPGNGIRPIRMGT